MSRFLNEVVLDICFCVWDLFGLQSRLCRLLILTTLAGVLLAGGTLVLLAIHGGTK